MEGWIKIYRKIKDHWIWDKPLYLKLWLDFIIRANHNYKVVAIGRQAFSVQRGKFITSYNNLARDNNCSISKIRAIIRLFEKHGMIYRESTNQMTKIIICNYNTYQDIQQSNDNQTTTNKNEKNYLKEGGNKNPPHTEINYPDKIRNLWIRTFGRLPKLPELEETKNLIEKYSFKKVEKVFRKSVINGAKSLRYILNHFEQAGGDGGNGTHQQFVKIGYKKAYNYQFDPEEYQRDLERYKKLFG
ncbi:hypothetical protein ACFLS9_03875 [Bacteroidota bacterium]